MLTNYLKIAIRNFRRNKAYSIINISGLSIGMVCLILIAFYIKYELSYDKFHKDSERIYRIDVIHDYTNAGSDIYNKTPAPLAEALKSDCLGIEFVARLRGESRSYLIHAGENSYMEDKFFYTDPSFLTMFSFPLISGNPETAFNEPYSIIITDEIANKYFGNENPIGKTITVEQKHQQQPYNITGVIKKAPGNSHIQFNFLASVTTLYEQQLSENYRHSLHWNAFGFYTYIKVKNNSSEKSVEASLVELVKKYKGDDSKIRFLLEPIERIHLYQNWEKDIEPGGDIRYLYLFAAIGFFILLIACFNYINISTAQSVKRAKEVGLRKVAGASRTQLIKQFLSESLVFSFLAFCLAIVAVELVSPFFQAFFDKEMQVSVFIDMKMFLSLLVILILVGCIAGVYPAYYISVFKPTQILKGVAKRKSKSVFGLRNSLVVFQFVISAILIVGTITIFNQLHYMRNKKLGMKKDHIVTINVFDEDLQKNYETFFNELTSNSHIIDVSASQSLPPGSSGMSNIDWDGKTDSDSSLMYGIRADYRFARLYEMSVILGNSSYSEKDYPSFKSYFLINRSALKTLGWKDVIGRRFGWNDTRKEDGQVIGVIDDFNFFPLDRKIEPLAIELVGSHLNDWSARYFSIKISSQDIPGTLSYIEKKWKQHSQYPIQLQFFDERMNSIYKTEQNLGLLFNLFAVIAILIGSMGLYGLTLSSIQQRIREIGIRKVLGSSIVQIVNLLSKEIIICVLIANLIACPIAYYFMNKWLQDFAYRVEISWWVFALSGGTALVIALVTVSFQAIKAATANPVEALRYE
ncbi:MAG: ABC transporter permease [Ignavibacteria bacterium]|jgi:putative ABC transport system permease protein